MYWAAVLSVIRGVSYKRGLARSVILSQSPAPVQVYLHEPSSVEGEARARLEQNFTCLTGPDRRLGSTKAWAMNLGGVAWTWNRPQDVLSSGYLCFIGACYTSMCALITVIPCIRGPDSVNSVPDILGTMNGYLAAILCGYFFNRFSGNHQERLVADRQNFILGGAKLCCIMGRRGECLCGLGRKKV